MKHTEKQIEQIAKDILEKTNFIYDTKEKMIIRENEDLYLDGKKINSWNVSIFFGEEDWGKNQLAGLVINDDNGHPIYLQHSFNSFIYYKVNDNGEIITEVKQGSK
ncbi:MULTISPECIES: hypothetical protein [Chryseobacterium]|uniref:Uncharacterized protein n=2 Tax=Chryseobacterium TaxID=59732 RepID=A0A1H7VZF2_9FLAO|nr:MULTISPECIES: hypothetical protein [Chryseobacterium]NML55867.1 hypothetical protein [Chryseobacterium cheonjiense]SEM14611.1 hypothetical protein SAMN05421856_101381 [Chryseobacterium taichungense]